MYGPYVQWILECRNVFMPPKENQSRDQVGDFYPEFSDLPCPIELNSFSNALQAKFSNLAANSRSIGISATKHKRNPKKKNMVKDTVDKALVQFQNHIQCYNSITVMIGRNSVLESNQMEYAYDGSLPSTAFLHAGTRSTMLMQSSCMTT